VDKSRTDESKPPNAEEVKERAGELPDYSIDMIFLNDKDFSSGDQSKIFMVRTGEKSLDLVQTAISRLLAGRVKEVKASFEIKDGDTKMARVAELNFTDAKNGEPAYASPSRVTVLLGKELQGQQLGDLTRQMVVRGKGEEKEGLFQTMEVTLPEAVNRDKF